MTLKPVVDSGGEALTRGEYMRLRGSERAAWPDPITTGPSPRQVIAAMLTVVADHYDVTEQAIVKPVTVQTRRIRAGIAAAAFDATQGRTWPLVGHMLGLKNPRTSIAAAERTSADVIAHIQAIIDEASR